MKVSIVIPCYNLGEYLEDTISSVEAQTFTDWEIIIVDDGSNEESTLEALRKIEEIKPYKLVRQKNAGLAEARNAGIKQAKGEYIVCLDADDMLAPTYIEKAAGLLDRRGEGIAFATTWLQEFGARKNVWKTKDYNVPELLMNNIVHVGSMFRRNIWEEVGGYKKMPIGGYEDWDFWLSIVEKGYKWAVVKEPLFYYRIREGSMLTGAKSEHTTIYKDLYRLHPKLFKDNADGLIIRDAQEIRELHDTIAEKDKSIEELEAYKDEVLELREKVFKLRDELHAMKNARVLGKIIKTRELVGSARKSVKSIPQLPRRTLHKTRVVVAPFVPRPVRLALKRSIKQSSHKTRVVVAPFVPRPVRLALKKAGNQVLNLGAPIPASILLVDNERWEAGQPLVTVVVPYYNRADTIDDTIDSLKSQSFTNFEVLLINDGSTEEKSIEKLKEINGPELKLKVITQKNEGVAAARNKGISEANGKYIICLDSDDMLASDFIEKCTVMLEASPEIAFVTTNRQDFGVINKEYTNIEFNPAGLIRNNNVITAAEFRKEAWQETGGYKSGIGYEDWEFWLSMVEKGWWGRLLPEPLFKYRTSLQSRYVEDKDIHWRNMKSIKDLHPKYRTNIKNLWRIKQKVFRVVDPTQALINLNRPSHYAQKTNDKPNILVALPWMTFGGAETLILNFCKEIEQSYNLSFVTGLESAHEWEYKFKELSDDIYHLTNLFDDPGYYVEFVSNYIKTRGIDIMHVIHTSAFFDMLPEIKKRHPNLRVVVTVFNDRAEHFSRSVENEGYVDAFSTDNKSVKKHYEQDLKTNKTIEVIPNGINCYEIYNPALFNRNNMRDELGVAKDDLAIFFIGRVSEEKNPDVFCKIADNLLNKEKLEDLKFFVIGDGPMGRQVEKMITDIKSKNIQYLGYQPEVSQYLSAADIFILPSSIEGFPLSILEAMAMKVAVIASDVGAVAEVIDDKENGFVVTPGSVTEISKAIKSLDANREELKRIKNNARKKVENTYSNKILGTNYKKLYEGLRK